MDDKDTPPVQRPLPPVGGPTPVDDAARVRREGDAPRYTAPTPGPRADRRSSVAGGVVLILLGVLFLAGQFVPGLWAWVGGFSWPLMIIAVGLGLLVLGLLTGVPGLAVPGCVVGGIGLLLNWQNNTGRWESWAYAWALIPGFVGVGTLIMGLYNRRRSEVSGGLWLIVISAVLFGVFASFLGGFVLLGRYWPVLLIALGLLLLVESLFRVGRAR